MTCPSCEYNKLRAAHWRREAYRLAGHPLPEKEMTKDDIIRMAREAGFETTNEWAQHPNGFVVIVERFATLVAAAEREACAKVCEETTAAWTQHLYNNGCVDCAAAIRARSNP